MIKLVRVRDKDTGQVKAHELLKKLVNTKTLLALSGGKAPNYKKIFIESGDILPGAIAVVDERFGQPFHDNSNELLLKRVGIKNWADENCIETHKVLKGKKPTQTAAVYEKEIMELFKRFKKRVGVMGIGANVHTAGVFPKSEACKSADLVVSEVVDDKYPQRITMTLKALGKFSAFVVLMFGQDKKEAFRIIMDKGENDMQKYPAIFYRKSKIPTYLITDIKL